MQALAIDGDVFDTTHLLPLFLCWRLIGWKSLCPKRDEHLQGVPG